jgi:ABC-type spermidine/putrescine transport system permease subunit II
MTCSGCGNTFGPEARFCPRCGAPAPLAPPYVPVQPVAYGLPYVPYNRVARNLQTLSIFWLVYATWRFLTGLAGVIFLHGFFGNHFGPNNWGPNNWSSNNWGHTNWNFGFAHFGFESLWPIALTNLMISVACAVLVGYALYTRRPWARILAIIFGILALFHPLLGTALGIYTLYVMAPSLSGAEYDAITAASPQS